MVFKRVIDRIPLGICDQLWSSVSNGGHRSCRSDLFFTFGRVLFFCHLSLARRRRPFRTHQVLHHPFPLVFERLLENLVLESPSFQYGACRNPWLGAPSGVRLCPSQGCSAFVSCSSRCTYNRLRRCVEREPALFSSSVLSDCWVEPIKAKLLESDPFLSKKYNIGRLAVQLPCRERETLE